MESAKNLSMGEKVVKSFKKLGEGRIFSSSSRSPLGSIQILFKQSLFNFLTFSFSHHLPNDVVVFGRRKNCNCLCHFLGIHGDCSTSVREEFHPNPLQIQIQIYNTAIFNHRSLFRYANSSTLLSYGCLWVCESVSEWAEFHTSVAWSLFLYWKCVFPFDQGPCFWSELDRTASNFRGPFGPFLIVKGHLKCVHGLALTFPRMVWKSQIGLKMTDLWSFENF